MAAGIPDKLFYKIGEAAHLASLRPSILRYWETEFSVLQPGKSRSGQRLYSKKDLETIFEIKRLLYSEKLTIQGARKVIAKRGKGAVPEENVGDNAKSDMLRVIGEVRDELKQIRDSL
jgi:DNA-binding transcriptional MerR regulator